MDKIKEGCRELMGQGVKAAEKQWNIVAKKVPILEKGPEMVGKEAEALIGKAYIEYQKLSRSATVQANIAKVKPLIKSAQPMVNKAAETTKVAAQTVVDTNVKFAQKLIPAEAPAMFRFRGDRYAHVWGSAQYLDRVKARQSGRNPVNVARFAPLVTGFFFAFFLGFVTVVPYLMERKAEEKKREYEQEALERMPTSHGVRR